MSFSKQCSQLPLAWTRMPGPLSQSDPYKVPSSMHRKPHASFPITNKQGIYTHKLQHFVAIQVTSHSNLACHTFISLLSLKPIYIYIPIFLKIPTDWTNGSRKWDLHMSLHTKLKKAEHLCGIMVHLITIPEPSHALKTWEMASCRLFPNQY